MLLWERVRSVALDAGLDAVGVGRAEPFLETRRHLVERKAAGLHGGMHFTYGNPHRATDPASVLPGARSLVVGARSDRKSTRLNSSHSQISYAVFCLKK